MAQLSRVVERSRRPAGVRTAVDRGRVATWGGFVLGLVASPLVMLILASALTGLYRGLDGSGEYGVAVATTRRLASALDRYRNRHQRIPDPKTGLAALAPDFVDHVPNDPWGHPYVYEPTGPGWADVLSYGADGRGGGSGAGSDVSARFGRLGPRPPAWLRSFATLLLMGVALGAALAGGRRRWSATALAGISAFWGILLLATISGSVWRSFLPPLGFAAGLACITGSIALVLGLPYARIVAMIAVVAAYSLLQFLLSG